MEEENAELQLELDYLQSDAYIAVEARSCSTWATPTSGC